MRKILLEIKKYTYIYITRYMLIFFSCYRCFFLFSILNYIIIRKKLKEIVGITYEVSLLF